ncbi:MAG: hypothetical protein IPN69_16920 [Acidobacteria bacterium]|nr:hypothetical protein [Acidobacteriota bacterium]
MLISDSRFKKDFRFRIPGIRIPAFRIPDSRIPGFQDSRIPDSRFKISDSKNSRFQEFKNDSRFQDSRIPRACRKNRFSVRSKRTYDSTTRSGAERGVSRDHLQRACETRGTVAKTRVTRVTHA